MPDATGLELIAQRVRERRSATRPSAGTAYYREQATLEVAPAARARRARLPAAPTTRSPGTCLMSLHGVRLPARGAAPRRPLPAALDGALRPAQRQARASASTTRTLPTVVDLFPTADFQEREVYDMFGVVFDGHPDMRRILMPEDYVGFPQRRDFPMGGEPVLFTFNENKSRAGMTDRDPLSRPLPRARALGDDGAARATRSRHEELFTLNIGPHHPATHGVLRLLTTLQGEVVRDVKPIIGYVHTGIEKSCEDQQYWKVITFVERMDYLAYYYNATAYCMAVEKLLEIEVPAARAVPARCAPGAEPDRLSPVRARHRRARPRRRDDALVGLPRPRPRARPVRDVVAASACTRATSRSAASSRTSRPAGWRRRASSSRSCRRASTSTRTCSTATRSGSSGSRAPG